LLRAENTGIATTEREFCNCLRRALHRP